MIRRRTAAIVAVVVLATACTGADDAAPTTTAETDEPDDALVTIPPAAQERTTNAPTTTRAPIDIRTFPEPNWPPVDIPTSAPVRPEALTVLVDEPPSIRYDVSPDGNWLALLDDTNRLCLVAVAELSTRACADGISSTRAVWSPDSSKVVFFLSSIVIGESGPLGTLATDGTVVTLLETDDPASPFGGATSAGFVDDDTVIFTRMLVAPSGALIHEVHTIGVDGTNDAVVGTLAIGNGTEAFFPDAELFDGTTVYFQPNGRSMAPGSWRYEPTSGTIGLVAAADEGAPFSAQPVGVRAGLLVTADRERLGAFTSNRDEAGFFALSSIDGTWSIAIDDLDTDYMILSAALSPDGAQLAVFELYRGDDSTVADSEASGRVSIASVESLSRGDAAWSTITGVGPGTPSNDLDRDVTTITWPTADRIHVELLDRLIAVAVGDG